LHNETLLFNRTKGGELRVLNCFPNTYEVGMASLGYQTIFKLFATDPRTHATRYFTNWNEIHDRELDLLSFSISWELDFINLLFILDKLNIPLLASERGAEHPLIYGGGPVLSANPEPWAAFFDFITIGDSEDTVPEIISVLTKHGRDLKQLAAIPGIYVPSLKPKNIERARATAKQLAYSSVIAPDAAWKDTGLLEVVRSCPELCRFCLASYLALPFRTPDLDGDLIPRAEELLSYTNNLGLLGASVSQHPEFIDLLHWLVKRKSLIQPELKVQVASMRATTITAEICTLLKTLGVNNITIAIESGSERLRDIINKKLPQEAIYNAVEAAASAGLKSVKFYGMVGLPYETDEDIQATIDLLLDLRAKYKQIKLIWGCSVFTPKAQTPFQDFGIDSHAEKKLNLFKRAFAGAGIELRAESYKWAEVQALISRGDQSLAELFIKVYKSGNTGANIYKKLLDSKTYKHFVFDNWLAGSKRPWDFIGGNKQAEMLAKHAGEAAMAAV